MSTIWIVTNGSTPNDDVRSVVEYEGFAWQAVDGHGAPLEAQPWERAGLVVIDADGPDADAVDICRRVRGLCEQRPIVMVSERSAELDKVNALAAGADDYVVRPFGPLELAARFKAALRRSPALKERGTFRFGSITVDFERLLVTRGEEVVDLSPRELDLLRYFVMHEGQAITRRQLIEDVWGVSGRAPARPLDMQISRLRRKLGEDHRPGHIRTVHRIGYRFVSGP